MCNTKTNNNIDMNNAMSSRIFCRFGNSCLFISKKKDISGDQ